MSEFIFQEIRVERHRQNNLFGQQNHNPFIYLSILGEEVGEVHKAALESYDFKTGQFNSEKLEDTYREELIQVAAVAVAMVESFDRTKKNET